MKSTWRAIRPIVAVFALVTRAGGKRGHTAGFGSSTTRKHCVGHPMGGSNRKISANRQKYPDPDDPDRTMNLEIPHGRSGERRHW
jgi:hypothetical protein